MTKYVPLEGISVNHRMAMEKQGREESSRIQAYYMDPKRICIFTPSSLSPVQSLQKNLNTAEKVVYYLKYCYFVIRGG